MISKLNAPSLKELLLGDNFITNINAIRKLDCPHLIILSLCIIFP